MGRTSKLRRTSHWPPRKVTSQSAVLGWASQALFLRRAPSNPSEPAPNSSIVGASGVGVGPPPAVEEPTVTSSNAIAFAVPLKLTDCAVPANVTPIGVQKQKAGPTEHEPLEGKLSDASIVPVPSRPLQTVTVPGRNAAE